MPTKIKVISYNSLYFSLLGRHKEKIYKQALQLLGYDRQSYMLKLQLQLYFEIKFDQNNLLMQKNECKKIW